MRLTNAKALDLFDKEKYDVLSPSKSEKLTLNEIIGIDERDYESLQKYSEVLIDKYAEPLKMDDEMDLDCSLCLARLLHINKLSDKYFLKLISGMILHFCDSRATFTDRVCVLAAIFLKKDDFDIKERKCYNLFAEYLPDELRRPEPLKTKRTVYEKLGKEIVNPKIEITRIRPIYIQQAIKVLKNKEDILLMKKIYDNIEDILRCSSKWDMKNHGEALYNLLIDINTPALYDVQFRSLAYFISLNFEYYDNILRAFFETKLETFQFYVIYTLNALHDLLTSENRVTLHLKFTEAFIEHDKVYAPPVRKEIEAFITKGIMMLGMS